MTSLTILRSRTLSWFPSWRRIGCVKLCLSYSGGSFPRRRFWSPWPFPHDHGSRSCHTQSGSLCWSLYVDPIPVVRSHERYATPTPSGRGYTLQFFMTTRKRGNKSLIVTWHVIRNLLARACLRWFSCASSWRVPLDDYVSAPDPNYKRTDLGNCFRGDA